MLNRRIRFPATRRPIVIASRWLKAKLPNQLQRNAVRNTVIGPGLATFDVQFRAELFNILNHPSFAVPSSPGNTGIFDSIGAPSSVAGLLTSTTTTAREIQFALKVIW